VGRVKDDSAMTRRDFVQAAAAISVPAAVLGSAGVSASTGDSSLTRDDQEVLDGAVVVGPVPLVSPVRGLHAERMRLAAERRAGIPARVASWEDELDHVRRQVRTAREAGVHAIIVPVVVGEHEPLVSQNVLRFHEAASELREDTMAVLGLPALAHAIRTERVGLIPQFQGMKMIEADLALLPTYRASGAAVMSPTHLWKMPYGDGAFERSDQGLTATGRLAVGAMNREGVVIDLSGMGPRSSRDAMEVTGHPVIFSHSNARAVYDHPMNLSDEHLTACAGVGGVVGVSAFPAFVSPGAAPTVEDVLDHVDHIVAVAGVDHVSLGLDFTDLPRKRFPSDPLSDPPYHFPEGLSSFADLPRFRERLSARGYGDAELDKIFGGNLVRILRRVW